ncbi:Histone deacetylase hda1 [Coemansia sp. RSA 1822]|nr:Histone deacetylase hda1 [Coemansia sp. RSA 1822]
MYSKQEPPTPPLTKRVGYVYDVRMKYHQDLEDPQDPHPEDPRRIYWIYNILKVAGCLDIMKNVPVTPVTDDKILRVHTSQYLETLKDTEIMERATLLETQKKHDSVFLCKESQYCARMSAGGLLALCEDVVRGKLHSGLAIIRPPGHHACSAAPMGFCLLNNIAITVRDLQARKMVNRVMVVDWDVHHGNGIQEVFYSDSTVLYASLHRYDEGEFYPSSTDGGMNMVGEGDGKGYNINIPWVTAGVSDGDYIYAFKKLLLPVARQFCPDMIIVASGFDAAVCDPIGECDVTPECYACMTSMLKSVSNGKLVLSLEGGYNLDAIANSALACVKPLLNIKWKAGHIPQPAIYLAYATLSEEEVNGPFGTPLPRDNRSWEAVKQLDQQIIETDCATVVCHCHRLPVSYDDVSMIVPRLHLASEYSIVVHCGAGASGVIRLEKCAHRAGYVRPGNKGPMDLPPNGCVPGYDTADELVTAIDVDGLRNRLEEQGWNKVYTSVDAGHYVCDFTFYTSLAEGETTYPARQLPAPQTLFVHVHPQADEVYSDTQLAELLRDIVRHLAQEGV